MLSVQLQARKETHAVNQKQCWGELVSKSPSTTLQLFLNRIIEQLRVEGTLAIT